MIRDEASTVVRAQEFAVVSVADDARSGNNSAKRRTPDLPNPDLSSLDAVRLPATLDFADWGLANEKIVSPKAVVSIAVRSSEKASEKKRFEENLKGFGVPTDRIESIYDSLKSNNLIRSESKNHSKCKKRSASDQALVEMMLTEQCLSLLGAVLNPNKKAELKTQEIKDFARPCLKQGILPASIADFIEQLGVSVGRQKLYHLKDDLCKAGEAPAPKQRKKRKKRSTDSDAKQMRCEPLSKDERGAPVSHGPAETFSFPPLVMPVTTWGEDGPWAPLGLPPSQNDVNAAEGDMRLWDF
jgi:hypothetical protein